MTTASPQRIFIVEDEVTIAFEMSDTLEDLGFEVVGPSVHLSDAEKKAANKTFDVACLDVNLGNGKTSKPVAEILRERSIPYVFLTAYDADQVDFIDDKDIVLKKPVSQQALVNAIKRAYSEAEA
ncbi:response regulator [Parvularcula lutaonensis]|uniref:Response regulator n=1 Tax=Parvularcula lutaonensis TaxID=491923 RepID=A0ABV7MDB2_9PROT|nr:response regulator [Parvularcula lutaonensis]GGY40916.1 response regulator [Parvularcula lutaonensis]